MFDPDQAIRAFLTTLDRKKYISRETILEIEAHLRDELEDRLVAGEEMENRLTEILASFGPGESLIGEYEKMYRDQRLKQLRNVLSFYFNRRTMMRVFLGALLGLFFILGGLMLEGGNIRSVIQLTAALIVVGGAGGVLLIAYPVKTVWQSVVLALTGREAMRAAYLDAAKVFRSFGDLAILTGLIGVVFGIIHVLENLETPQNIGPGLAVALVSILYGLMARLFIGKPLYDSFIARAYPSRILLDVPGESPDDDVRLAA